MIGTIFWFNTFALLSLVDSFQPSTRYSPLHYAFDDHELPSLTESKQLKVNNTPSKGGKEPTILKINSLDELQYFLQEDEDRLAVVKFYAPYCKTCQRLGNHFGRLAREWGDGIVNRSFVKGRIRCAEVEFKTVETSRWVTEELHVPAVPTLQLYSGLSKIWQGVGAKNTKQLQDELLKLVDLSPDDLRAHGESVDDGILQQAVEDNMYATQTNFLNEEW